VSLAWAAPANNGATVTGYTVTPTPACAGCAGLSVTGSPAATSTSVTGLTTGTSYTFTVTATNSAGTSSASPASTALVPAVATATLLTVAPATPVAGQLVTLAASVSPTPGGGTVSFSDAGTPIPGCAAQPVNTSGVAVCTTSYPDGGDYTIDAVFSGSANGAYMSSSTAPAARVIVANPSPTPVQPTSISPVLQPPAAHVWLSSMARVTDPYLINEHVERNSTELKDRKPCKTVPRTLTHTTSVGLWSRRSRVRVSV
jgi:hypothetical protein